MTCGILALITSVLMRSTTVIANLPMAQFYVGICAGLTFGVTGLTDFFVCQEWSKQR